MERDSGTVQVIYGGQCSQEMGSEKDWLHNFLGLEQNENGGPHFQKKREKVLLKILTYKTVSYFHHFSFNLPWYFLFAI